jgi:hypothetical protein
LSTWSSHHALRASAHTGLHTASAHHAHRIPDILHRGHDRGHDFVQVLDIESLDELFDDDPGGIHDLYDDHLLLRREHRVK